jgi:hypothetical protein
MYGISEYICRHGGFRGEIKRHIDDFRVWEVHDGVPLENTSTDIPELPAPEATHTANKKQCIEAERENSTPPIGRVDDDAVVFADEPAHDAGLAAVQDADDGVCNGREWRPPARPVRTR